MPEQCILALEQQLAAANEVVAKLTLANATLTRQILDSESRHRKLKRNARNDESALQDQLTAAQNRRG